MRTSRITRALSGLVVALTAFAATACNADKARDLEIKPSDEQGELAPLDGEIKEDVILRVADMGNVQSTLEELTDYFDSFKGQIEYVAVSGIPEVIEAMAAGEVDIASNADIGPVVARLAGIDVLQVAALDAPAGIGLYASPANGDIKGPEDLKGKKVGYTQSTSAGLWALLAVKAYGLELDEVELINLGLPEIAAALRTDEIDAGLLIEPNPTLLAKELQGTGFHLLLDGKEFNDPQEHVLYATRASLEDADKAPLLRAYVEAYTKAFWWRADAAENQEEWIQALYVKKQGLDPAQAQIIKEKTDWKLTKPIPLDETLEAKNQEYVDVFIEEGTFPAGTTATGTVDFRFDAVQRDAWDAVANGG